MMPAGVRLRRGAAWARASLLLLTLFGSAGVVDATTPFLASAARIASGTATVTGDMSRFESAVFLLIVSAAATDVGDTLDVYLQSSADGGTTWNDFVHFTQVLGNGGAKTFVAGWQGRVTAETELGAPADGALAAGVLQGPVGDRWRVKWVIVDTAGANASFTFKVDASLQRGSSP